MCLALVNLELVPARQRLLEAVIVGHTLAQLKDSSDWGRVPGKDEVSGEDAAGNARRPGQV